MTRTCWYLPLFLISFGLAAPSFATDWTLEQKEILAVVAAYTEASHQRDFDAYLNYWHSKFLGWHNGDENPTDHAARAAGLRHYFDTTESLQYEFEPIAVQILLNGDAAIVHYKSRSILKIRETGETVQGTSYWTDYLVRENERWLLISDHGGNVPDETQRNQT